MTRPLTSPGRTARPSYRTLDRPAEIATAHTHKDDPTTTMYQPISNPHYLPSFDQPSWRGIATSYLVVALIPVLLWALSDPLNGLFTVAIGASLLVGRRASS